MAMDPAPPGIRVHFYSQLSSNFVGGLMNVGDLVKMMKWDRIGIITYLWRDGSASVFFEDGEWDVYSRDLEVISESR